MPNRWVYMGGELMSNGPAESLFFLMARQRLHELPVRCQAQGGSTYGCRPDWRYTVGEIDLRMEVVVEWYESNMRKGGNDRTTQHSISHSHAV